MRQGIKARRTRNEGRVRALVAMRDERAARREQPGAVRMQVEAADPSGRLVFEAKHIAKSFEGEPVVSSFSTRVMRGDRIGLIGPNGAGKTTLLRLLLGEIRARRGRGPHGRERPGRLLRPAARTARPRGAPSSTPIGDGNDTVTVNGRTAARERLPGRLPVPAGARAIAGEGAVGRRAQPPAAGAAVHAARQRAGARRADQRPRPRVARTARGAAGGVPGHAAAREPRPRVPRQRRHEHAGVRGRRPGAGIRRRLPGLAAAAGRVT